MHILLHTDVEQPLRKVADGFNEKLFRTLAPPFPRLKLLRFDGSKKGDWVAMELHFGPLKQTWVSEIVANGQKEKEWYFIDEGRKLPKPLQHWHHHHRLLALPGGGTRIVDDITYSTGNKLLDLAIYPALLAQFLYRKPVYKKFFR
jgi:ligand-binding SRPBCC domain-containing protein